MATGSLPKFDLALKYGHELLRLTRPKLVLGRAEDCDITLPSGLVSRRHAEVTLDETGAIIRDLGSRNGVVVNSDPIQGSRRLEPGDTILLGDQSLELVTLAPLRSPTMPEIRMVDTLATTAEISPADTTHQGNVFDLLGTVVDKQLALGRGVEAEKLLRGHLERTLANVKEGADYSAHCEKAASYALKLADATGKAEWIDYTFTLYGILKLLLPRELVDELYRLLRKVKGVNVGLLRDYVALVQQRSGSMNPADRFALQRLLGLEQLLL
jgi:hypothetical protein